MAPGVSPADVLPRTVVFKLQAGQELSSLSELNQYLSAIGAETPAQVFPFATPPRAARRLAPGEPVDLTRIYQFQYQQGFNLIRVINDLRAMPYFDYVEPRYIQRLHATVDDPLIVDQWHIEKVGAFLAWDIEKGSEDVVIAIIDTGFDFNHPDLADQAKVDPADPDNGVDDDGDGFVDNNRGWDFVDEDNFPQAVENDHGVHVSGCAAPVTNNSIGVAGVGYNCKILPVKAGEAVSITHGYEGIAYAAERGAQIINCSWGGSGRGQMGQDVINFAVLDYNALVVASAGNTFSDRAQFPAAYDHVMSVAATDFDDGRSGFSTYNHTVDISSPGGNILSTRLNGDYGPNNGTSMAAPIVCGSAGLLLSHDPSLNAFQLQEILKATADDHYGVNQNGEILHKLGTGRVNVFNALNWSGGPAVVMSGKTLDDGENGQPESGEDLLLTGLFTNHLDATGSLTATLRSPSPILEVLDSTFSIGVLGTGQSVSNENTPFRLRVAETDSVNVPISLEVTITDGTYTKLEFLDVVVNVDYVNITVNDIWTTLTSKGNLGYNIFPEEEGLGFFYQGQGSLLYEGGLMVGINQNGRYKVVDRIRGFDSQLEDVDFEWEELVSKQEPFSVSDFDVAGVFNDSEARSDIIGLTIEQSGYAWTKEGHEKYVLLEYTVNNTSGSPLNGVYVGFFTDWDLGEEPNNRVRTDVSRQLMYTFSPAEDHPYVGVQLLTRNPFIPHALDLVEDPPGIDLDDENGFNGEDKFNTLSTWVASSGLLNDAGNDVAQVVSSGPFDLDPGESTTVAFAFLAGDSLPDLQRTADSAWVEYNGFLPNLGIGEAPTLLNYPNPAFGETTVWLDLREETTMTLSLVDVAGRELIRGNEQTFVRGTHVIPVDLTGVPAGTYFLRMDVGDETTTRKIVVLGQE